MKKNGHIHLFTGKQAGNIRIFLACCFLALLWTGCKEEKEITPYLELSLSEINFTEKAGEQTVDIHTNILWETRIAPATEAAWLSVTPTSGTEADLTLTVQASANPEYSDRSATIMFKSIAETRILQVNQKKKEKLEILTENEYSVWQPGDTLTIAVSKNVDFTVAISENAKNWITQVQTKALTTDKLRFIVSPNSEEEKRYGEIYILEENALLADTVKVWQDGLVLEIPESLDFGPLCQTQTITILSSFRDKITLQPIYGYSLPEGIDWCAIDTAANAMSVSVIAPNETGAVRETDITITSSTVSKKIRLTQTPNSGSSRYTDQSYTLLQQATKGKGINLVIMGDGFTRDDLRVNGAYNQAVRDAMQYYFSIEPFQSYRDYFTVYMVVAESEEEGVSGEIPGIKVKNKFGSTYGSGTAITCDLDLCQDYIRLVPTLNEIEKLKDVAAVVILNSTKYAGTTSLYSNGLTIALCPMSDEPAPDNFEGLIHHEACGHGFGLLNDEYYETTPETEISANEASTTKKWQQNGFYLNVDFTDDRTQVLWKDFICQSFTPADKYAYVGVYEGGATYTKGVWRPEQNSCMNRNIAYFNAPSRWAIVKRIMKLAGNTSFTFSDFVKADRVVPPASAKSTRSVRSMRPLGKPQLIERE